jgi:IS1 family transposase
LPPLTTTLLDLKSDALEIDELCISKKHNQWLWLAVSRYTGQIVAATVGRRDWNALERLWYALPERWRRRLVYTDGYSVYTWFFWAWQHRVCAKGDGGTNTVEGVNNALRQRCGALVRRSRASLARSTGWLWRRLCLLFVAHNQRGQYRLDRRRKTTQKRQ